MMRLRKLTESRQLSDQKKRYLWIKVLPGKIFFFRFFIANLFLMFTNMDKSFLGDEKCTNLRNL